MHLLLQTSWTSFLIPVVSSKKSEHTPMECEVHSNYWSWMLNTSIVCKCVCYCNCVTHASRALCFCVSRDIPAIRRKAGHWVLPRRKLIGRSPWMKLTSSVMSLAQMVLYMFIHPSLPHASCSLSALCAQNLFLKRGLRIPNKWCTKQRD